MANCEVGVNAVAAAPAVEGAINNESTLHSGVRYGQSVDTSTSGTRINNIRSGRFFEMNTAEGGRFACPFVDAKGVNCKSVFASRSGIWRHCVTVHGSRYYSPGRITTLTDGERSRLQQSIRRQQHSSKTSKRNVRRCRRRTSAVTIEQQPTDDEHGEPVVYGGSAVSSATIATVVGETDIENRVGGDAESWQLTAEDYEDLSSVLTEFEGMAPQPTAAVTVHGTGWATTTADAVTETDRVVQSSIGTSTEVVSTRHVGVGGTVPVDDLETIRGYERALELPERMTIAELYDVFRGQPGVPADVLARRLTISTTLGRPLSGAEHELVEFAFRIMSTVERGVADGLMRFYQSVSMVRDPEHARRAFQQLHRSLSSRPNSSDEPYRLVEPNADDCDFDYDHEDDPYM
jgi:hypothetical protein